MDPDNDTIKDPVVDFGQDQVHLSGKYPNFVLANKIQPGNYSMKITLCDEN